ncbi:MAG: deoxyguanosinetriphosphate triphosphohydrolase [Syntrophobacteraceae bacterium CG2_30_61_12]|nr:MAG: deoxyguanosinetriphosphate triphosphohydrolase [Syntrophobacteraceae bacterium CG2_30_61_12]
MIDRHPSLAARDRYETVRQWIEAREAAFLAAQACLSQTSRGRPRAEPQCPLRTVFQRDRDRIVHSKAFRRLKHKTQVFLAPTGDHYRTRLTHTLEVSQIARTMGRALALNEDLIEAIALGHDLGHTAFGHGGERVLNEIHPGGFFHNEQSLRVVDRLERNGRGLNLTEEVRDGIVKHSKGRYRPILAAPEQRSITLEGQVVRIADIVAYLNHDLDDAIRAELLAPDDVPGNIRKGVGGSHGERIHRLVEDTVMTSLEAGLSEILLSPAMLELVDLLRAFLFERVYTCPEIRREFDRAHKIIADLYQVLMDDDDLFVREVGALPELEGRTDRVCDHIAGMTDRYALDLYQRLFLPRPWLKR